ncbi:winged helix-turn-helix transcriptional regulator [Pseudonocardia acaciae]|uniref:winged helix-turn-helix transcriptional regulator n=1 Tax=Pseudonocardia acaciae TaxID=551276 RepID=UPI0004905502|nr:helix-turn-helix domain-containing protein [Pseudonocardia acaciae]
MVGRRKYDNDGCAVAHGLDLVGERWALLVVRELLLGPKRFTDLRAGLPGVSADMLTQRLRELTEAGIVSRRRLAAPAASWVYELTEWGAEVEPVVLALAKWSSRSPGMRADAPIGIDSVVLELRTMFDPAEARGFRASIALRLNESWFRLSFDNGALDAKRADVAPAGTDAALLTDPNTLSALVTGRLSLAEAEASGALELTGNRTVVQRALGLFPLPAPA